MFSNGDCKCKFYKARRHQHNFFVSSDLGFAASCDGERAGALKSVDFDVSLLRKGTDKEQYFVVCVPETTPADIEKRKNQRARAYFLPSGQVVPRLLGCPNGSVFNGESKRCERDVRSQYDNK